MNKSRGRRAGKPDTRAEILHAARERFLSAGYTRASLRSIAADAGVDVALLSYHFTSKQGLFTAAMAIPVRPGELLDQALDAPLEQWPERILRTVLNAWEDPQIGPVLRQTVLTESLVRVTAPSIAIHLRGARLAQRAVG